MSSTDIREGNPTQLLTDEFLKELFPPEKADEFFDALYGGAEEGAFDIELSVEGFDEPEKQLILAFQLTERPGKCMACSLTYGLPPVFERHPIINLKGIIEGIQERLDSSWNIKKWQLGPTTPKAPKVNIIPIRITLEKK